MPPALLLDLPLAAQLLLVLLLPLLLLPLRLALRLTLRLPRWLLVGPLLRPRLALPRPPRLRQRSGGRQGEQQGEEAPARVSGHQVSSSELYDPPGHDHDTASCGTGLAARPPLTRLPVLERPPCPT